MGSKIGHIGPGCGFLLIGIWHLFNHIKLHCLRPGTYVPPAWFPPPSPRLRYLEPAVLMAGTAFFVVMEIIIGPEKHHPFDDDGTIPTVHLHNLEHSAAAFAIFVYAALAVVLDRLRSPSGAAITELLGAAALAHELFLFHVHSTDHKGVEGQFHWLLQVTIFVSLAATLLGMAAPRGRRFVVIFVRSASIAFQGVWFVVIGFALYTPELIAKGCFMHLEEGHFVVRCRSDEDVGRAKALANIFFSCVATVFSVVVVLFYVFMVRWYRHPAAAAARFPAEYVQLARAEEEEEEEEEEALDGKQRKLDEFCSFVNNGDGVAGSLMSIELQR